MIKQRIGLPGLIVACPQTNFQPGLLLRLSLLREGWFYRGVHKACFVAFSEVVFQLWQEKMYLCLVVPGFMYGRIMESNKQKIQYYD